MVKKQTFGSRPTRGGMFVQHVIVFLICVVFPGATTMVAPATWLKFERSGETVRCKTWTCMYFVVPFKVQKVDQVQEVTHRERASKTERQREFGRTTTKTVTVEGEGFLQIHGPGDQLVEVSVSPASLISVLRKVNEFMNSTADGSKTIFTIANWKFGALLGGLLTLFTILYVVGYTLGFLKWIFTRVKKTA